MREKIMLVSTAGSNYVYYTTKNKIAQAGKLVVKKYDPIVKKHVLFEERNSIGKKKKRGGRS